MSARGVYSLATQLAILVVVLCMGSVEAGWSSPSTHTSTSTSHWMNRWWHYRRNWWGGRGGRGGGGADTSGNGGKDQDQGKTTPTTKVPDTPTPTTTVPDNSGGNTPSASSFAQEMLHAVNAERKKENLSPLCINNKLQAAAQGHSDDMARNNIFSHTGSGGSQLGARVKNQRFQYTGVGENIAAGQQTVAAVMESWMNSPGHRANILNGNFQFFGMGYTRSGSATYKHYWTQNFGSSSSEACSY